MKSRYGDPSDYDFAGFCAERGLNLYLGYGVAWDEDGNVLCGGRTTWWAKLIPDAPHGQGHPRAVAIGLGGSAREAVARAVRGARERGW
jgi:hypothetical protein